MKKWIYQHFLGENLINLDQDLKNQLDVLIFIALFMFLASTTSTTFWTIFVGFSPLSILLCLIGLSSLFSLTLYRWLKSYSLVANLILVMSVASVLTGMSFTGNINSLAQYWLILIPLIAGYLHNFKAVTFWLLFSIIAVTCYLIVSAHFLHGNVSLLLETRRFYGFRTFAIINIFSSWIAHIYLKRTTQYQKDIAEKNKELQTIVQIACHDLGNVIGIINHSANFLKNKKGDSEKLINHIYKTSNHAKDLLSEIRQLQASKEGRIKLHFESIELYSAIKDATYILKNIIDEKNIKIVLDTVKDKNINIVADKIIFIGNIISNILSNAIKFSAPEASIYVDANITKNNKAEISFTDNGIGIPPDILDNIFQQGRATSRIGTQGEIGTGFGMPLIKAMVELNGGEVKIESRDIETHPLNHGTTLTITLNLAT